MTWKPANLIFEVLLMALVAAAIYDAQDWPSETNFFPLAVGYAVLALTAVIFVIDVVRLMRRVPADTAVPVLDDAVFNPGEEDVVDHEVIDRTTALRVAREFLWLLMFCVAVAVVGFYPAVLVYLWSYLHVRGKLSILMSGIWAGVTLAVVYGIFDHVLMVPPYMGLIGPLLR